MPEIRSSIEGPSLTFDADSSSAELVYKILDTLDAFAALGLLDSTAPEGIALDDIDLFHRSLQIDPEGHHCWRGTASYKKQSKEKPELQTNESSYQFETGGGNMHITHSLSTIQSLRRGGGPIIDFKQAIGFNGDEVAGCDIIAPAFSFSETHVLPAAAVTGAYKLALFAATGKVNNASFKGFAAGEVLFLGAAGSKRGDGDWEITYRFAASANATGMTIGGISGINKKGWEYLWMYFTDETSGGKEIKIPEQVCIEQVYALHNFATIGIGT